MAKEKTLIIGTRGSALALVQADLVMRALKAAEASLRIEVLVIQTHGDTNQGPIPLDTIGKGWFTREIEQALLTKEIDLAVHSLKDMAEDMPEGLDILAYLPREDARDALITKNGEPLEALRHGAVVGTDSARRGVQMLAMRPDLRIESLRGNVPTRLKKLYEEPYDAVVLAAAGLKRLGLAQRITRYFSVQEMTPAPGQGILAIQAREDDDALSGLLASINDAEAASAAHIERSFSRAVGGGCKSPTGAYSWREGAQQRVVGMIVAPDKSILREEMSAPRERSHKLGELLAKNLLSATAHAA